MSRLLPALAVAVLVALAGVSASATTHVRLPGCGGSDKPAYKPKTVIVTCGDGNFRVVKLKWSSWTRTTAIGKGSARVNTCDPNCASGKFKKYKVKLSASKPADCAKGKREFIRLTYSFPGKHPAGSKRTDTLPRPCSS